MAEKKATAGKTTGKTTGGRKLQESATKGAESAPAKKKTPAKKGAAQPAAPEGSG